MNKPQMSSYKDALTEAMDTLASNESVIFIGQQIVYPGNPMSSTLVNVSKDKMIEVPVMEETQMGMTLGLAMTGKIVVSFYPRWNFLICAANQLINHIDKYKEMTEKNVNILIRVGKGADTPLDPGPQHKSNFIEEFRSMCPNIKFHNLISPCQILKSYKESLMSGGVHILVEYPELYSS
jgi:pyruvate/2-oxoglutarate/acetoin dehydrogenase E1 component